MTKTTEAQAASILARLKNLQRQRYPNIPPNLMLLLYAQQGLLARLGASEYAEHFILKGALNLFVRYGQIARATEDIDLAPRGFPNTLEHALSVFKQLCQVPFADGLQFDPGSVTARMINETLRYSGVALTLRATLSSSQISLPLD